MANTTYPRKQDDQQNTKTTIFATDSPAIRAKDVPVASDLSWSIAEELLDDDSSRHFPQKLHTASTTSAIFLYGGF